MMWLGIRYLLDPWCLYVGVAAAGRAWWFRAMERLLDDLCLLESGCHDKSESKLVFSEIHPIDNEENMHVDHSSSQSMRNGRTTFRHSMQFSLSMSPSLARLSLSLWRIWYQGTISILNHHSQSATVPPSWLTYQSPVTVSVREDFKQNTKWTMQFLKGKMG